MAQNKNRVKALQSFIDSVQDKHEEPKITIDKERLEGLGEPTEEEKTVPTEKEATEEGLNKSVQKNIKELKELEVPPISVAPDLTPEQEEEMRTKQKEARNKHRGRPLKWSKKDENGHTIREDGYRRTSMIVNIELALKMKEIAFREGMTEKDVLEQAMRITIDIYEKKNGVVVPNPSAYTAKKDIFN